MAAEFLDGLVASGTTSALVFGSHFAPAMDELFAAAGQRGLNITSGLVLSDRILRPDLLNSPETALADSADLILRWHDRGRLRYAVTPRFSLSASDEMLDACAQLLGKGVWFTSHINENLAEIATVAGLFPGARHYLDTYCRHGLVTARSVFAHNVHPGDAELALLAEHGASVAHCPTSNSALGSGLFPLRRHVEHGIHVALGSDVGAGAGLFLPKEALQAYFIQQLLGPAGLPLTPVHLLYLATRAGARALGLRTGSATSRSARTSTRSGCARPTGARWRSTCGTPATPPTRWPGSSPWPPRRTWPGCGCRGVRAESAAYPDPR